MTALNVVLLILFVALAVTGKAIELRNSYWARRRRAERARVRPNRAKDAA